MRRSQSRLEALREALAGSPAALPAAVALGGLVAVSVLELGYEPTVWYPAALVTLGLWIVGALALPRARRAAPAVRLACAALAGYAAWSYLSIAWAHQKGMAWEGANRTALYAVVFALFALWPIRGRVAALLLGGVSLAIAGVALVELLGVARADNPSRHFLDGRFAEPVNYANASAALWSAAFWPCVVLASRREAAAPVRGLFVAAAVLLGGVALMGQSRGWLFALPVVALVFVLVTPRRLRTLLTLALAAAGVAVTIPAVLDVYDESGRALATAVDSAARSILLAALVAGVVAALAALPDRQVRVSVRGRRRLGAALAVLAAVTVVAGTAVYVSERGSPFTDIADAWGEFKSTETPHGGATRLGRLGSDRYDFWRVAWERFEAAPLQGIGADNYQEAYLRYGKSAEQPVYPHSVEMRVLSQTGLVGAALLVLGWGAALVAAGGAMRRRAGWGVAAAAGGVAAFVYWLVHGSVDWLWEFPALGAGAFALLGLAAGLAPRRPGRSLRPRPWRAAVPVLGAAATVALALSFTAPWFAERHVKEALEIWRTQPARTPDAFEHLDSAAAWNPLGIEAKVVAGSIAVRLDREAEARRYFRELLDRYSRDSYSHMVLGALAFDGGRRAEGLRLLRRAVALAPRDEIAVRALRRARRGARVDIDDLNRSLSRRFQRLGQ